MTASSVPLRVLVVDDSNTIRRSAEIFLKQGGYEVLLAENFQLEFDEAFNIVEIDGVTALPASVIPDAILDYVAEHYATYFITDWELELDHQQVELNNKVELEFRMDGTFIRIDND